MARTVEKGAGRWAGLLSQLTILNSLFLGLRLYQWLWVLLCVVGALAVAAPRVLSQPVVYYADAQARFDTARYGGIYSLVAPKTTGLAVAIGDAGEVLRQEALARGDVRYGRPDYLAQFIPQGPGVVMTRGVAPSAEEAQALANAGTEELARQVRAAGGREILRNMLGWELWLAMEPAGKPAPGPFDALLREIIRTQAFPMSRQLEPFSTPRSIDDLPREELSDVARALESRYDLWRFAINTRNATLDALCGTAGVTSTSAREQTLLACAATSAPAAAELDERDREINRMRSIEATLAYVVSAAGGVFDPDEPSAAHRVAAALPAGPQPRYITQLIALAALFGLAFGFVGVAVDRSAGVADKSIEIWGYRELIRNLVLRDLRARYKGSALGYLWTQLAPLGMMLVYVVVFSLL
ncbi:MAG: ABC transporter permease, partial [Chloroflexales bacterium]|nr:ABC transporter permease [Chloroflexales bacterium]